MGLARQHAMWCVPNGAFQGIRMLPSATYVFLVVYNAP
jgi:hypothetical protein